MPGWSTEGVALAEHRTDLVVHGDDVTPETAAEVYGPAAATGRLRLIPYTEGVSTTELIARVLSRRSSEGV